ncbi:hypothetical protein [Denitromonas sp.]|uniref:c-type cytochrome n=1 Tax=Denitromonas sp. TaxID=2734609 RepID=UPI002AFFB9EF|nr:hypothetical protein [Denitromonas sp.]
MQKIMRATLRIAMTCAVLALGGSLVPATAAEQKTAQKADFVQGAKLWAANCGRCHNIRDPKDLRDDYWYSSAYHMRVRAGLTGQDTRDIIKFLQESN